MQYGPFCCFPPLPHPSQGSPATRHRPRGETQRSEVAHKSSQEGTFPDHPSRLGSHLSRRGAELVPLMIFFLFFCQQSVKQTENNPRVVPQILQQTLRSFWELVLPLVFPPFCTFLFPSHSLGIRAKFLLSHPAGGKRFYFEEQQQQEQHAMKSLSQPEPPAFTPGIDFDTTWRFNGHKSPKIIHRRWIHHRLQLDLRSIQHLLRSFSSLEPFVNFLSWRINKVKWGFVFPATPNHKSGPTRYLDQVLGHPPLTLNS